MWLKKWKMDMTIYIYNDYIIINQYKSWYMNICYINGKFKWSIF